MAITRKRRIKRVTVIVLAVPLLLSGYVSSYLAIFFARGVGMPPMTQGSAMFHVCEFVYRPLVWYTYEARMPGSETLRGWQSEVYLFGESLR